MSWGPQGPPNLPPLRIHYIEFTSKEGYRYLCDAGLSAYELESSVAALKAHGHRVEKIHVGLPGPKDLPKVTFVSRWWY